MSGIARARSAYPGCLRGSRCVMHVHDVDPDGIRRLAAIRPDGAPVVSMYLHLAGPDFALAPSRASEITSLLDEAQPRRAVVLVSRRTLRVFADRRDHRLAELVAFADEVHGQHEQGGWSQANYERSVERDVDAHLARAAREVFQRDRRRPFDLIAIGATAELYTRFCGQLHAYLRERVVGRVDIDVERATPEDAARLAQPLFDAVEERRVDELLGDLRAGLATGRSAAGLADTLVALNQRRVETLLYEPGFTAAGVACTTCGWLGRADDDDGRGCPACGHELLARENVREDMVAAALLQSADVQSTAERPDLGPLGGIAAVLRF